MKKRARTAAEDATPPPLIYVAGPYRAPTAWQIEQNIRAAEEAALEIWQLGAGAICPHTMNRFFEGVAPDQVVLPAMIELLRRCDALLVLPGYEKSEGTCAEIRAASEVPIPMFRDFPGLVGWLQGQPGRMR